MKRSLIAQRRMEETIERMQTQKPRGRDPIAIAFTVGEGHRLLWTRALDVGYDATAPLARDVTFSLAAGDRLAIVGPNGSGKTTVLRTLLGELPPLSGQVRLVPSTRVGYFDQETRQLPMDQTAPGSCWPPGKMKHLCEP